MNIVLPILIVASIFFLRVMHGWLDRAEERINAVNGGDFSCEYRRRGGMEDADLTMTLSCADFKCAFTLHDGSREREKPIDDKLPVPLFAVDKLRGIYLDCGVYDWKKLKKTGLVALDAPKSSITFRTALGEYTVYDDDKTPSSAEHLFGDVIGEMEKWRAVLEQAKGLK